jgi:hypothetical protein
MNHSSEQEAKRQELARSLDCFTSAEFRALANITESTEQAWRKRNSGPPFVRLGTEYFYPRKPLADFMQERIHERRPVSAKAVL